MELGICAQVTAVIRHERAGCARPSGRARIGTSYRTQAPRQLQVAPGLRVGRGLEHCRTCNYRSALALRPAFGSGEDWNVVPSPSMTDLSPLRPAFGSGEDWNLGGTRYCTMRNCCARPSGRARIGTCVYVCVRAGGRWLRPAFGSGEDWNTLSASGAGISYGCARPSGRARIGTSQRTIGT